jgi:transcriptional regulator with XRE-family HTH domain
MITQNDVKYAERLRGLRLDNRIKQENAFLLLGLKRQQDYSLLENGKKNFTDELILKICEVFKVSPQDFVNPSGKISILNSPNTNSRPLQNSVKLF